VRWRFDEDTVENLADGTLHRAGCAELDADQPLDHHPAGSSQRRDSAPRECWACRPDVRIVMSA